MSRLTQADPFTAALCKATGCCVVAWILIVVANMVIPNPMPPSAPGPAALYILAAGVGALGLAFASGSLSRIVERVLQVLATILILIVLLSMLILCLDREVAEGIINVAGLCALVVLGFGTFFWMLFCVLQLFFADSQLREEMTGKEIACTLSLIILGQFATGVGLLSGLVALCPYW